MTENQMQQEIQIIKKMIEKTKVDAADSGHLFIFIGIACVVFVITIMIVFRALNHLVLPVMIGLTVLMAILGYFIVGKKEEKSKLKSYPKSIAYTIAVACSLPGILTGLIFPWTGIYPFSLAPVFAAMFFGIMLISISIVYDIRYLLWAGIFSWVAACLMAYFPSISGFLMIVVLVAGFIVPGIRLNRKYRSGRKDNGI